MSDTIENGGIYRITCRASGKSYIGSAVNFKIRFKNHKVDLRGNRHHSPKLQRAWNKYGEDAFEFAVIEKVESRAILLQREQYWIDYTNAVDAGYNICKNAAASMLGRKFSDEHKAKLSAAHKGKIIPPEAREKMRQAALNRSPEVAKKIADSRPRKPRSEEAKRKTSESLKGRKLSEEAKAKIGEASRGRKHSEESKAKAKATKLRNKMLRELGLKEAEQPMVDSQILKFTETV